MAQTQVVWRASAKLRTQELVATGDQADTTRSFTIDLKELTPEQRQVIVAHVGVGRVGWGKINMENVIKFDAEWYGDGLRPETLYFDAEPTVEEVITWIKNYQAEKEKSNTHVAAIKAEKQGEKDRKTALYYERRPEVEAMIEATDLEGLNAYTGLKGFGNWSPTGQEGLSTLLTNAVKEIAAARASADKEAWIAAHGSDRLKRGFDRGHDCQRLYVIERAAVEASGFVVDFNDTANWRERSCPTTKALDTADESKAISDALGLPDPVIVWLIAAPSNVIVSAPWEYDDYDEFSPSEAVVITHYLGKYDLVKIV